MSTPAATDRYSGILRLAHHNARMWWFVLAAANVGALVLLLLLAATPIGGSRVPGLIAGGAIWILTDAVLAPIAIVQLRKRLILDFDSGTLRSEAATHPASEFHMLVETTRSYPGRARMLTLVYRRGSVDVQVDGFTPNTRTWARDAALLAFIRQWLPVPEQHRSTLESGPMLTKQRIGLREAAELLGAAGSSAEPGPQPGTAS